LFKIYRSLNTAACNYHTILQKGIEHLQTAASSDDPGTNPPPPYRETAKIKYISRCLLFLLFFYTKEIQTLGFKAVIPSSSIH
jgi:hypothetical protein